MRFMEEKAAKGHPDCLISSFSVLQVSKCMRMLSKCCFTVLEGQSLQLQEFHDTLCGGESIPVLNA